jgi:hypothetical protein
MMGKFDVQLRHSLCRDLSSLVLQFKIFKFINFWQPVHLLLFTRHFKIFLTFDYRIPKCIPHIPHSFPCNSILSREIPWVTVYSIQTAFYILLFSLTPPPPRDNTPSSHPTYAIKSYNSLCCCNNVAAKALINCQTSAFSLND